MGDNDCISRGIRRICAEVGAGRETKSFTNKCFMEKEACENDQTYYIKHEGVCKIVVKRKLYVRFIQKTILCDCSYVNFIIQVLFHSGLNNMLKNL